MAVFSGMLIATILGVLIVPGLYVMIESIGKKKKIESDSSTNVTNNKSSH
jgi:HAE1 family hydrophobic/amphiphilic exporter-1